MRDPLVIPSVGMRNGLQLWTNDGKLTIQLFDTVDRALEATFDEREKAAILQYIDTA